MADQSGTIEPTVNLLLNAMGHDVKTYIGVNMKRTAADIKKVAPGYMPMGSAGMGEMGSMEMPLPDNTLPMMTGFAQFGPVEMGEIGRASCRERVL